MTMPMGKLAWGQAGEYDAVDDREVITALARGPGLIIAPALSAGSGLNVQMGRWLAIAEAGDGTLAVIGSRDSALFGVAAGGSAARTDVVWADIDPEDATWELGIYAPSQIIGRPGIRLGTITVPANASTAAAMTLQPSPVIGAGEPATMPGMGGTPAINVTGTAYTTIASRNIPGGDARAGTVYELEAWGNGTYATGNRQTLSFRIVLGGTAMTDFTLGTVSFSTTAGLFRWRAIGRVICRETGGAASWQSFIDAGAAAFGENLNSGNAIRAFSAEAAGATIKDTAADQLFAMQAAWGGTGGSPTLVPRVQLSRRLAG